MKYQQVMNIKRQYSVVTWKVDLEVSTGDHIKQELEGTKTSCLNMGLKDVKRRGKLG